MTKLPSRVLRHLTYANVMASIAVFVALGGVGYAATTINGGAIKKQTIGAGKLKNGTLTSNQVKQNALTGSVIDESSLSTVPSAQTAVSATTATSAVNAEHAISATSATTADSATTASDADTLDGLSASDLQVSCPVATEPYGGMCWDEDVRPAAGWIVASIQCGEAGGRLPSLGELIAYVFQPGEQVSGQNWSGDVIDLAVGKEQVLTSNETSRGSSESTTTSLGYRCLFYPTN
jgi:hypothetical protein